MAESLIDLQAQLTAVNAEITRIISGGQLTELQVGIGPAANKYKFTGVSLADLRIEKARLLTAIAGLSSEIVMFRSSSRMSTTHRKF
jgi:hypothetical protein